MPLDQMTSRQLIVISKMHEGRVETQPPETWRDYTLTFLHTLLSNVDVIVTASQMFAQETYFVYFFLGPINPR